MAQIKSSNLTICPECDEILQITGKIRIGQKITCRRCHKALVIVNKNPLEVDFVRTQRSRTADLKSQSKPVMKKGQPTAVADHQNSHNNHRAELNATPKNLVVCPECHDPIDFQNPPKLRQAVICNNCEEILQVVNLKPLLLAVVDENYWD